jgi:Peptidase family M1 domain
LSCALSFRLFPFRTLLFLLAFIVFLTPTLATAQSTPEASPALSAEDAVLYEPVVPNQRDKVFAETDGELSLYQIDATLTAAQPDQPAQISGDLDLSYVNTTGEAQEKLYFRLYPNSAEYGDGAMVLSEATVAGVTVEPEITVEDTLAGLTLPEPVADGASTEVKLHFETTIPTDPARSYGMFSYQAATNTYALAHWLPLLAGYDPVSGWNLSHLSVNGDPVFTNTALFDITLSTPMDLIVVTTGNETAQEVNGDQTRHHFVSGPVRDFVMAADPNFESESQQVGETMVTSWYNPNHEEGGGHVLDQGAQALALYNERFGEYPYEEMDLVEVDLGNGAGGVEFPQIMFIGSDYYGSNPVTENVPGFLEFVVVHEVAHQWWYGLVGNDQYVHAFTDEGMANYASILYFNEQYGPEVAEQQANLNLVLPYLMMLFTDGDEIVDQPTDAFPDSGAYGTTIYGKSALGFQAIHEEIGDDAFYAGLKAYVAQERFGVALPEDLTAAFEQASGKDLTELWRHWFEAEEGVHDYTEQEYQDLLNEFGL